MPVLRMVKLAIKKSMIHHNPFEEYEISKKDTDRRFLLKADVEKIMQCSFAKKGHKLVRDLFVFSCFTGLSYTDVKKLKQKNIRNFFDGHQWVISRRKKTDVLSNIRLLEIPKKIIEKYRGLTKDEFVFPVPSNTTCNKHLSGIMAVAGITTGQKVTFHYSKQLRDFFASIRNVYPSSLYIYKPKR